MRAVTVAVLLLFAARPVLADDRDEEVTHYYSETLSVDALSIGALVGGWAAEGEHGRDTKLSETLMGVGMTGTLLAAPVVHWSHGNVARGVKSMLLRLGMAGLGMTVAFHTANCDEPFCKLDRMGPGFLIGVSVASLIDAAVQTEERKPAAAWAPIVAPSEQGLSLGMAARW